MKKISSTEITVFVYNGGGTLVAEYSTAISNTPQVSYFLADHLGSTNGLIDSSGNLTASTNYDAFGNATNTNFPNRYQFTGREYDNFTGLHYYRARFYDSNLGRFISEDPIGLAGGINLYGYVGNKPLSFIDPYGLDEYAIADGLLRRQDPDGWRQRQSRPLSETLDELQMQLGIYGMIPGVGEPFDALDGAISLGRGNYGDAALSVSSMVPFWGWGAGVTKICKRASKYVDLTDFRRTHILNNHKAGVGKSGKSEFPSHWSDDELIHHVSDVAVQPPFVIP